MEIKGRLTKDAEIFTLPNTDTQVVNFSLAVNQDYTRRDGSKVSQTVFFNCAYWRSADVAQQLSKGKFIELDGSLKPRLYQSTQGETKVSLDFRASQIKFPVPFPKREQETTGTIITPSFPVTGTATVAGSDLPF